MGKLWERYGKGMGKVWERYGISGTVPCDVRACAVSIASSKVSQKPKQPLGDVKSVLAHGAAYHQHGFVPATVSTDRYGCHAASACGEEGRVPVEESLLDLKKLLS